MLPVLDHHPGHADLLRLEQGIAQQRIDFFALVDRRQVVRALQVDKGNLGIGHKAVDGDGLRRIGVGGPNLVVGQHGIPALLVGDALDDVFRIDLFAGIFVDAPVAHRVQDALVEPVEIQAGVDRGRMQGHRDVHQAKAERSLPDCTGCHGMPFKLRPGQWQGG